MIDKMHCLLLTFEQAVPSASVNQHVKPSVIASPRGCGWAAVGAGAGEKVCRVKIICEYRVPTMVFAPTGLGNGFHFLLGT